MSLFVLSDPDQERRLVTEERRVNRSVGGGEVGPYHALTSVSLNLIMSASQANLVKHLEASQRAN